MCLKKTAYIAAGLTLLGLVSCSLFDRDRDSLTAPAGGGDLRILFSATRKFPAGAAIITRITRSSPSMCQSSAHCK